MIIDVIGVKWSLVLSNILLMSARLLLAFTTKVTPDLNSTIQNRNKTPFRCFSYSFTSQTSVAVFVLYFLMPFGQALNIPVSAASALLAFCPHPMPQRPPVSSCHVTRSPNRC